MTIRTILICIISLYDGELIGTQTRHYGLRAAFTPVTLKTPQALVVVSPQAFGYDLPYQVI